MTWTTPAIERVDGSLSAPEPELLRGLLDFHRSTLLYKAEGLTAEQLVTAPIVGSNLTMLGLIRHLSKVERIWFRRRFRSEPIDNLYSTPEHKDADFENVDATSAEADYAQLVIEQEAARAAVAAASLDETFLDTDGEPISLRFVFVHMIGEYARHNGHADLIRQCLDGVTGA